jgi:integrase
LTPISGFSKFKAGDDLMLAELRRIAVAYCGSDEGVELVPWTIHDLRRTARSLMSQARVDPDHAERALGTRSAACGASMIAMRIEKKSEQRSRRWRVGSTIF